MIQVICMKSRATKPGERMLQEEDLIKLFGGGRGAGSVSAVRVVRDAKSNKGKGIAYVEFQTRNDARMALGFDGHTLNGRAIRVSKIAAGDQCCCGSSLCHTWSISMLCFLTSPKTLEMLSLQKGMV